MIRVPLRWIALLLVPFSACLDSPLRAESPAAPARLAGPEHARLTAMCGTYDVTVTFWFQAGGEPVVTEGTSTIRPLFEGLFVEEKIEGTLNGSPFTTLAWTGYNTSTLQYEATRIASTNTIRILEAGAFDEASGRFELKAEYSFAGGTWRQRTVIQPLPDGTPQATSYLSFDAVPEWKGVEIRYSRTPFNRAR